MGGSVAEQRSPNLTALGELLLQRLTRLLALNALVTSGDERHAVRRAIFSTLLDLREPGLEEAGLTVCRLWGGARPDEGKDNGNE